MKKKKRNDPKEHSPSKARKSWRLNTLSKREVEILNMVVRRFKNEEIAEKLFVSLDTIKKRLYNAYQMLYVNNRIRAVKRVQELGLIDEE